MPETANPRGSWSERPPGVGSEKARPSSESPARWVTTYVAPDYDSVQGRILKPWVVRNRKPLLSLSRPPEGGPSPLGTQGEEAQRQLSKSSAGPNPGALGRAGLGTKVLTVTPEEYTQWQDDCADAERSGRSGPAMPGYPAALRSEFAAQWAAEVKEKRERYEVLGESSHWHSSRAKTMSVSPLDRECDSQRFVSCGCKAFPVGGCNSRMCKVCNGRRWGQIRRRVLRAIRAQGGSKWRMMTLTGPPRATPAESMAALQKAWARMRAWLYKRWRKAFDFVLVIEVGTRNGLIHMHCLAKFPGFVSYSEAGEQWTRCYPGAVSGGLHFSKREVLKDGEKTGRKTTIFTPESGAAYIAKYATKGSELLKLPAQLAARTLAAMHGRRIVRASQGFWTCADPVCSDCGWRFGMASGPGIEFALAIYREHGKRTVGENEGRPNAPNAKSSRGAGDGAKPYRRGRSQGVGVLVAD